ncbi:MAG: STAS domain-containing protein [candidate division KSB1 bacterium]|jgi:anti-sigma B factor antagonist|nr:STAS domain-containing protein [candidate division KSB1 bacterium]
MEGIQLSVKQTGANNDISIIKVGGYIDTTTSAELEHSLDTLLKSNNYNIIIDLENVDYISSAGWGIFISELKGIRDRGGDLKLVKMMPDVYEVFELLEFHYILKAFDSIEDAIADFDKRKVFDDSRAYADSDVPMQGTEIQEKVGRDSSDQPHELHDKAMSVDDKIRKLVMENPEISSITMFQRLKSARFGNQKIGYFQLLKVLKKMNLNSKKKRVEFFKKQNA